MCIWKPHPGVWPGLGCYLTGRWRWLLPLVTAACPASEGVSWGEGEKWGSAGVPGATVSAAGTQTLGGRAETVGGGRHPEWAPSQVLGKKKLPAGGGVGGVSPAQDSASSEKVRSSGMST